MHSTLIQERPKLQILFDQAVFPDITDPPTFSGTVTGESVALEPNPTERKVWRGAQSAVLDCTHADNDGVTAASLYCRYEPSAPLDLRHGDSFAVVVEFDHPDTIYIGQNVPDNTPLQKSVDVVISNTTAPFGTTPRASALSLGNIEYKNHIHVFTFRKEDMLFQGDSETDFSSILRVDVRLGQRDQSADPTPMRVKVHSLFTYNSQSYIRACPVMFSMDDGIISQYTELFRYTRPRRIPWTAYINSDGIDRRFTTKMTWNQVRALKSSGLVNVANHLDEHLDSEVVSFDDYMASVRLGQRRLEEERVAGTVKSIATPFGRLPTAIYNALITDGYTFIRGVYQKHNANFDQNYLPVLFGEMLHPVFNRSFPLNGVDANYDTAAKILARVDEGVRQGQGIGVHGHAFHPTNTDSTTWLVSEMELLIDGLVARQARGEIQVVTDAMPDTDSWMSLLNANVPSSGIGFAGARQFNPQVWNQMMETAESYNNRMKNAQSNAKL